MSSPQVLGVFIGALHVGVALVVSAHIVLHKNDVRSAIGWIGLVWLTPIIGSGLYVTFGINRIRRRAGRVRGRRTVREIPPHGERGAGAPPPADAPASLGALAELVRRVTRLPLCAGNAIEPLVDGDAAYPAMLEAIEHATRSVALATYIFDRGRAGTEFVAALERAVGRGCQVRVLIDGVGARYSHPPIVDELRSRRVPVARFNPSRFPVPHPYVNLRNHRKLLVVDGTTGFCGGMNIRDECVLAYRMPNATRDLHFQLRGPVVRQLQTAFAFDWEFTTRERLGGALWFPPEREGGALVARGVADGPDEDFEALLMTILGAIGQAARSIRVVTPYFLPGTPITDALRVAAMRGVAVDIVIPARGNLRLVQWAATARLGAIVYGGCRVYLAPPPFDHSKLMVVDNAWSLIGSANWDPRSLRLNFEYDVECYSRTFAARLDAIIDDKVRASTLLKAADLEQRKLWLRLRDGVAWLAQPYL
ncbi:MAG TPA: phospholipase D-like domain-containing protein [Gemmatimonadaceae bacterium]